MADTRPTGRACHGGCFSKVLRRSEAGMCIDVRSGIRRLDALTCMDAIRYQIVEIRYSRPPRITARDECSGRTAVFTWPLDAHPTQSELARIFTESTDSSDEIGRASCRERV